MDGFRLGAARVHRIEEWAGVFMTPHSLFAGFEPQAYETSRSGVPADYLDPESHEIFARIQSWVIEVDGLNILFDTGVGDFKTRPGIPLFDGLETGFLRRLSEAGFLPGDIDLVVCSHLHVDHVGWNTHLVDGRWVPTFPNARYVLPAEDVEYWAPENRGRYPNMVGAAVNEGFFDDSVRPILDRGLADQVRGRVSLSASVTLAPNPGHTPGSQRLEIRSQDEHAMFVGDVIHHPLQIANPDWNSIFCEDAEGARTARRDVLAQAAESNALLVPAHFAGRGVVRVSEHEGAFIAHRDLQPG